MPARLAPQGILLRAAWLTFAISVALLWWASAPTITFHDAGEFALAAGSGGIPHPPGAPSWCLAANLWLTLGRLVAPRAEPAYLVNLFSATLGAATIALAGLLAARWAWKLGTGVVVSLLAFPVATGMLLHSEAFVEQATTTEQYTFLTALLCASLLVGSSLGDVPEKVRPRRIALLGLFCGLAISNHLTQIVLLPFAALAVWRLGGRFKSLAPLALGCFLGLSTFVYVPLRSHANPILDTGNIESLPDCVWALKRDYWEKRPLSEAPLPLIDDWLETYRPVEEVGIVGVGLAILGLFVLLKARKDWLVALVGYATLYAGGLLLGHLQQKLITVNYVRSYGISDWHIPLYVLLAIAAGVGVGRLASSRGRLSNALIATLAVEVGLLGVREAIQKHSLHAFRAGEEIARQTLAPLDPDAIIVTSTDNLSGLLLYFDYQSLKSAELGFPRRWFTYCIDAPLQYVTGPGASIELRASYLPKLARATRTHPVNPPRLPDKQSASAPIYIEFLDPFAPAVPYLLPAGYLFEVSDGPVRDDEVRARERDLERRFPSLYRPGTGKEQRLVRLMMSKTHWDRGTYFNLRGMKPEARDAFGLACSYDPQDANLWGGYATALRETGDVRGSLNALTKALERQDSLPQLRLDIAIDLGLLGEFEAANRFLQEENARFGRSDRSEEISAWLILKRKPV